MIDDYRKRFWIQSHLERRLSNNLSDCPLEMILAFHRMTLPEHATVCEIGIGTGRMTRQLVDAGHDVVAVDCCKEAFRKLPSTIRCYLTDEMASAPACEFVICHHVFQHCNAAECQFILRNMPLSDGGIFSGQFAFLRNRTQTEAKVACYRTIDTVRTWLPRCELREVDGGYVAHAPSSAVNYFVIKAIRWKNGQA